jgi:signal transduction histidine kinase
MLDCDWSSDVCSSDLQQLPLIVQRIEMTLNKLEQPEVDGESAQLELSAWWEGLRSRNEQVDIEWHVPDRLPDIKIPSALFDCVIDNLLDNAIRKRQSDPSIQVTVDIQSEPLCLAVTDTGMPVPAKLAGKLLHGVVVSDGGLGIGLYQSARWAEQLGYRLILGNNQAGEVRFELQQVR